MRIGGRRILVDVERGRTVRDWKPTRLGGGLGGASRRPRTKRGDIAARPPRGGSRRPPRGGFGGGPRGGTFRGAFERDAGWGSRRGGPRDGHRDGYRDPDAGLSYGTPRPPSVYDDRAPKRPRY